MDLTSRFSRLLTEEEFIDSPPWSKWPAQVIAPIKPSQYGDLMAGDLVVTKHQGSFLRPCPATPRYNCCGLNIFHFGQGCDLGCSYCILSAYLGTEAVIVFGNISDGLEALKTRLDQMKLGLYQPLSGAPEPSYRFCTGEFTDSLLLDSQTKLSEKLIAIFRDRPPFILELKTKTAEVDHLLNLDHGGRVVISFSVNSLFISQNFEPKAAPIIDRLKAAEKASKYGYKIGLHFDPIVFYPGWERGYEDIISQMAQILDSKAIAFISLGCFRYLPALKPVMLKTRPSPLFNAEFIRGGDGKMRYPRPIRRLMYRRVLEFLKPLIHPTTKVYLCMESGRIWQEVFGFDPGTSGLTSMFK
ncbi:MAG: DNA photolyase [Deltaproteobacteria bacterium]|jgi:spore photoproduct lyase|nr:DNA photolyase [Deltaproteobacteria bacterium]